MSGSAEKPRRYSYPCPVCGDPNAYPLWISAEPPGGCRVDYDKDGFVWACGPRRITSVTNCPYQIAKAWQAAELRKLTPDAFDQNGNAKPGEIVRALVAFHRAHPDKGLV